MKLREIQLAATESNWRLFMLRKADPAFLSFQARVFERDQHTCQFCGFEEKKLLEVVNADGNYSNNKLHNLVTACCFCTQCFFLEAIGKSDFGGGTLIFFPDMTQGELNALCHVFFASIVTDNGYSSQAKNIYRSLKLRGQWVEKELGEGLSNPALYGQLLIDGHAEQAKKLHKEIVQKVRVLPSLSHFVKETVMCADSALKALMFHN
jgi:intracellular multiplication protein IcmJ